MSVRDLAGAIQTLSLAAFAGNPTRLVLGLFADPYPVVEQEQGRTRALLELLAGASAHAAAVPAPAAPMQAGTAEAAGSAGASGTPKASGAPGGVLDGIGGLDISIVTRSELLRRDLDLLVDLDQRHSVTVSVILPAVDPALGLRIEGHAGYCHPATGDSDGMIGACRKAKGDGAKANGASDRTGASPLRKARSYSRRLDLVRELAANGIATRLICTPMEAGRNNSEASLQRLFTFAQDAGAMDVLAAPHHPCQAATPAESRGLLATFERLRLEHGFPCPRPGRG